MWIHHQVGGVKVHPSMCTCIVVVCGLCSLSFVCMDVIRPIKRAVSFSVCT